MATTHAYRRVVRHFSFKGTLIVSTEREAHSPTPPKDGQIQRLLSIFERVHEQIFNHNLYDKINQHRCKGRGSKFRMVYSTRSFQG